MILQSEIESAKSKIIQVVGDRLPLKKRGATWWAPCPFHNEHTPSFAVSETKQRWKCFSCGKSGDTLDFIRMFYKIDFRGAATILGITGDAPSPLAVEQEEARREARKEAQRRRGEVRVEWNQLAVGLRCIDRLIARTEPLERESWWFTAELILGERLDELEAELRK